MTDKVWMFEVGCLYVHRDLYHRQNDRALAIDKKSNTYEYCVSPNIVFVCTDQFFVSQRAHDLHVGNYFTLLGPTKNEEMLEIAVPNFLADRERWIKVESCEDFQTR